VKHFLFRSWSRLNELCIIKEPVINKRAADAIFLKSNFRNCDLIGGQKLSKFSFLTPPANAMPCMPQMIGGE
jgi:hypothetical protein